MAILSSCLLQAIAKIYIFIVMRKLMVFIGLHRFSQITLPMHLCSRLPGADLILLTNMIVAMGSLFVLC